MELICEKYFYIYMGYIIFFLLFLSLNRASKTAKLAEDMQQNWVLHAGSYEISSPSDTLGIFFSFFCCFVSQTQNIYLPREGSSLKLGIYILFSGV